MSGPDRAEFERRLAQVQASLAGLPHGSVAYRDARGAAHHLQRLVMAAEDLPPTIDAHMIRRRR